MIMHSSIYAATALDAITDAIIDQSSLYRLATSLRTGVSSDELQRVVDHLKRRAPSVLDPIALGTPIPADRVRSLDLVVADSYSLDVGAVRQALRSGGILAFLNDEQTLSGAIVAAGLRAVRALQIAAADRTLHLYQADNQPAYAHGSYGVILSGKLYHGVLGASTFAFPAGKWSLLVGRSGVGKTTILELIAGLRKSNAASVIETSGRVFYLPQDAEPISGVTVDTNIGLFAQSRGDVDAITSSLHLQAVRSRPVDKTLSGGERQRVVIGQALASRADVMLMDEPSAGLDQARRTQMFHYLKRDNNASPPTLLCVAHDFMPIAEYFDHIFEIMNGTLVQHQ